MLKLATVFSGIGAVEHALKRMNIEHKIVFACDNGDVDILSKKIEVTTDAVINGFNEIEKLINELQISKDLNSQKEEVVERTRVLKESFNNYISNNEIDLNQKEIAKME